MDRLISILGVVCSAALAGLSADEPEPVRADLTAMIFDDGRDALRWTGDDGAGIEGVGGAVLHYSSGGEWSRIRVPFAVPSKDFHYEGPEVLRFYSRAWTEEDEQGPPPEPKAEVRLPPGSSRVLLLFLTRDFEKRIFDVVPVDYGVAGFPTNHIRVLNLSTLRIACRIGEETAFVEPRASAVIPLAAADLRTRLRILQREGDKGKWQETTDRLIRHYEGQRYDCFVLPPANPGSPRLMIRIVTDGTVASADRQSPGETEGGGS